MPENRARNHHRERVASTFSEEIGAMLEGELSDPRIAPSYITDVVLAPGGKSARIFVAVHGSEAEEASTLAGLMAARGYIRSELRERMGVRHVPELTFAIDRSENLKFEDFVSLVTARQIAQAGRQGEIVPARTASCSCFFLIDT